MEITSELKGQGIYLGGETLQCMITFRNRANGTRVENLAWASAQIHQPPVRHLPAARGRFQSARSGCDEAEDLGLRHLLESWRRKKLLVRGDVAEEQPVDLSRSSRSIHSQDRRGSSESQLRYRHPQVYLITFNLMLKCYK